MRGIPSDRAALERLPPAARSAAIADAAAEGNAVLVDQHDRLIGDGMNAVGTESWLSNDCAHPNDEGHH